MSLNHAFDHQHFLNQFEYLSDLLDVARADSAVDLDVQVGKKAPEPRDLLHHVTHELLPAESL